MVKVGDVVTYVDERRQERNALVQHVHNPNCINVVIMSDDPKEEDSYGRQIKHVTSLCRKSVDNTPGIHFIEK